MPGLRNAFLSTGDVLFVLSGTPEESFGGGVRLVPVPLARSVNDAPLVFAKLMLPERPGPGVPLGLRPTLKRFASGKWGIPADAQGVPPEICRWARQVSVGVTVRSQTSPARSADLLSARGECRKFWDCLRATRGPEIPGGKAERSSSSCLGLETILPARTDLLWGVHEFPRWNGGFPPDVHLAC